MENEFIAFISYSHADASTARRLQHRLESFRLPVKAHHDLEGRKYVRPVFCDVTDLNTGVLTDELRSNLDNSRYLIVVCSHSSAASEWVDKEVATFLSMGRYDRIIPLMIEQGDPHSLMPPSLRRYLAENPDHELLAVNMAADSFDKALVRIVSRMIGVKFDTLWERHRRMARRRRSLIALAVVLTALLAYWLAMPVTTEVRVITEPSPLPVADEMAIDAGSRAVVMEMADTTVFPLDLPGYYRSLQLPISIAADYFEPLDTMVGLPLLGNGSIDIRLRRDDTFATFAGTVKDAHGNPLGGVTVTADGLEAVTDADGQFSITVPLEMQTVEKTLILTTPDGRQLTCENETPSSRLSYIIY